MDLSYTDSTSSSTGSLPPKGAIEMPVDLSRCFIPATPNQYDLEKNLRGGYKVKFLKGTKQITILRFLVAKSVFDEEGLSIDNLLALNEVFVRLSEQALKDEEFGRKYGEWLFTISIYLAELNKQKAFPIRAERQYHDRIVDFLKPYLPSQRAYLGYRNDNKIVKSYRVILRNPLAPPQKIPPKRYIGVGYKDKGTKRDPAFDGTPNWKEVAMARTREELMYESTGFILQSQEEIRLFEK